MNKILILKLSAVLLLVTTTVSAQRKMGQSSDTLAAYREFVSLGKWYLNTPLQFKIHFVNQTTPSLRQQDNTETDILLYYGKSDFYMKAGELEQIVNDSLTILVNSEAKMIKLFPNANVLSKSMERIVSGLIPDSSLQKLSRQYSIAIEENGKDVMKMVVRSRNKISGTSFDKEIINITYQSDTHQPINYYRAQRNLTPVDSAIYMQMKDDPFYEGRLVTTRATKGELFFVMKEKTTECIFTEISRKEQVSPALQQQRIVRTESGEYVPAKGFEEYIVSKEF